MFSENELRDMLCESADQHRETLRNSESQTRNEPAAVRTLARRRGLRLTPLAAAVAVAAVAAGTSAIAHDSSSHPGKQRALAAAIPAASPPAPAAVPQNRVTRELTAPPLGAVPGAVDLVEVSTASSTINTIGSMMYGTDSGIQQIERDIGRGRTITLTVVPVDSLSATRVRTTRSVPIGGVTGYYSYFRLLPLAGQGPGAGKHNSTYNIVFRTPHGDWAIVSMSDLTAGHGGDLITTQIDDPAAIAAAYQSLHAKYVPNSARFPMRFGYRPGGARFASADRTYGAPQPGADLYLADGNRSIDVQIESASFSRPQRGITTVNRINQVTLTRPLPGAGTLVLTALNYPASEMKHVLDAIVLAPDLGNEATYFPLPVAIGR